LRAAHHPEGRPGCRCDARLRRTAASRCAARRHLRRGGAHHRRYTGRGPTRARTTINGEWIFVTLSDTLTKGEQKLAHTGRAQFVRDTRKAFQDAMRDEFVAEVEALTGRTVVAFLSDNHIDPDVGIECFQLAPLSDGA
jgi:uncharacterized protein YbcI